MNHYTAISLLIFDVCYIFVTSDRAPGNCHFTATIACENIRFSSFFAAGDASRGGKSATQRQKFHTDDANQCLDNKKGSHRVSNVNLSNLTCLVVDFEKVYVVFICQLAPAELKCFF